MGDERAQRAALEALQREVVELRRADDTHALQAVRDRLAAERARVLPVHEATCRALRLEQARLRGALSRRLVVFSPTSNGWVPALVAALLGVGFICGLALRGANQLWPLAGVLPAMVAFGRVGWRRGQRHWALDRARLEWPER